LANERASPPPFAYTYSVRARAVSLGKKVTHLGELLGAVVLQRLCGPAIAPGTLSHAHRCLQVLPIVPTISKVRLQRAWPIGSKKTRIRSADCPVTVGPGASVACPWPRPCPRAAHLPSSSKALSISKAYFISPSTRPGVSTKVTCRATGVGGPSACMGPLWSCAPHTSGKDLTRDDEICVVMDCMMPARSARSRRCGNACTVASPAHR
jgi:hypothetical protein